MLGRAPWLATVPLSSHGRCDRPPGHRSGTRRTQVLRPHPRRACNARDCGVPKRQSQPMRPDAPIELIPPLRSPAVRQTGEPAFERARRHLPPWPAGCARTLERVAGAGSPRTAAHACFVSVGRRSISARGDRVGRRMEGTQIRCFEPRRTDRRTPPCTSNTRTRYPRTSGVRGSFLTAIWRSASASKRAVAHGTPFPFSFPPYRIPLFQRLGPAIGPVSKTGSGLPVRRGFESLSLRLTRSSCPSCLHSPAHKPGSLGRRADYDRSTQFLLRFFEQRLKETEIWPNSVSTEERDAAVIGPATRNRLEGG